MNLEYRSWGGYREEKRGVRGRYKLLGKVKFEYFDQTGRGSPYRRQG
jgi:hypothetical protein